MSARDTPRMSREAESDDAADHRPAGGQRCENGHPCACVFENWSHGAIGQASSECCVHGEKECQPTPPVQEDGRDWWLLEVERGGEWRVPLGGPTRDMDAAHREAASWEEDGYRTRVTRLTPTPTVRAPEPERVDDGERIAGWLDEAVEHFRAQAEVDVMNGESQERIDRWCAMANACLKAISTTDATEPAP